MIAFSSLALLVLLVAPAFGTCVYEVLDWRFDLSALTRVPGQSPWSGVSKDNHIVEWNFCSPVSVAASCLTSPATTLAFARANATAPDVCTVLGSTDVAPSWSLLDADAPQAGVRLRYVSRAQCPRSTLRGRYEFVIDVDCDSTATVPTILSIMQDSEQCIYAVNMNSRLGCPTPSNALPSNISGGAFFGIAVACLLVVYWGGGIGFKVLVRRERLFSIRALPNHDLWSRIFAAVSVGARRVFGGLRWFCNPYPHEPYVEASDDEADPPTEDTGAHQKRPSSHSSSNEATRLV